MLFSKTHREAVVRENPSLGFGEVAQELGRKWRNLSSEQKDSYKPSRLPNPSASLSSLSPPPPSFENVSVRWACLACTFSNHIASHPKICAMCGLGRGLRPSQSSLPKLVISQATRTPNTITKLQNPVEELESSNAASSNAAAECCVCYDAPCDMIVLPCFHLCLCSQCTPKLRMTNDACPKCRAKIQDIKKVFI